MLDSILPTEDFYYLATQWIMSVWELTVLISDNLRIGLSKKYSTEKMVA